MSYIIPTIIFFCYLNYGFMNAAAVNETSFYLEYSEKGKSSFNDGLENEDPVYIQVFYETLCPYSVDFITTQFIDVVNKLHEYLKIDIYPYGKAKIDDKTGEVTCQHGPMECYGNMLHACALDSIQNKTTALIFNSCLMKADDQHSSDDKSAEECGKRLNVNSDNIKKCAKSEQGKKLLKYYGEETKKMNLHYVPYIRINNVEFEYADGFIKKVCKAFKNPPPPCN